MFTDIYPLYTPYEKITKRTSRKRVYRNKLT